MLTLLVEPGRCASLAVVPAARAIVSWTSEAPQDVLELTVTRVDGARSRALPYVAFEAGRRSSLDGFDAVARIATDVVESSVPIAALELAAREPLRSAAASTPAHAPPGTQRRPLRELAVPLRSQYVATCPAERGWCAPATLAMLLGAWGIERDVATVAAGVRDDGYGGTGNWTFGTAYAGAAGLLGAVAYLRDLTMAEAFIAAGFPIGLSLSWSDGSLPGAPLPASDGHLVVLRGFDAVGDPIVNDPAQPAIRTVYPRAAFERCWVGHDAVALLVAPRDAAETLLDCANG